MKTLRQCLAERLDADDAVAHATDDAVAHATDDGWGSEIVGSPTEVVDTAVHAVQAWLSQFGYDPTVRMLHGEAMK
jgi:hypothetical protein